MRGTLQALVPPLEAAGANGFVHKIARLPQSPSSEEGVENILNASHEILAVYIEVGKAVETRPKLQHLKRYLVILGTTN